MTKNEDNFIMLPTVDFCFKELMRNPKVRKGFIAVLMKKKPEEIEETTLLPTILRQEYEDDKIGILDVRVRMKDGTQLDIEMQVAYFEYWEERILFYIAKMYTDQLKKGEPYENLQKCIHVSILDFDHFTEDEEPYHTIVFCDRKTGKTYTDLLELQILELKKIQGMEGGEDIIRWMRFFSGKSREEFEQMAKEDEYLEEAYDTLKKLSADEQKRLEYEAREKALRDYNSQMSSMLKRGEKRGEEIGKKRGEEIGKEIGKAQINQLNKLLAEQGRIDDIIQAAQKPEYQMELLKEFHLQIE